MESLLLSKYETKDNNIDFLLRFKDRITFINGDSGIGKTMLFKAIERDTLVSKTNIICLNYDDLPSGNLEYTLNNARNKVIIIDNADVILSDNMKNQITFDDRNNQFIIFAHSTKGFLPTRNSITELVIKNNKGKLRYPLLKE